MSIFLTIILAFYPATLVWSFLPTIYIQKLNDIGGDSPLHFAVMLAAYGILYFVSYIIMKRLIGSRFLSSRKNIVSIVLGIFFAIILLLIIFYQILPGAILYPAPDFVSKYLLKTPFTFFAILLSLFYLYFE